jgi:hypothetical protein
VQLSSFPPLGSGRALFFAAAHFPAPMEYLDCHSLQGVPMPLYLSQHTLACLTRQGADALALRFQSSAGAKAERILVNMVEGKMFCEFRAASREALEARLRSEGMHFDWLMRIEWQTDGGPLQPAE